tara:strand:- start:37112 stop:40381 length:3270 start_codon:yes stop_codon:yes gene_type:complete
VGAIACCLTLALSAFEAWFYFSSLTRTIIVATTLGLTVGLLYWKCIWPSVKNITDQTLARKVDQRFPEVNNKVTLAIQLSKQRQKGSSSSPQLLDAAIQATEESTSGLDFNQADQKPRVLRAAKWFGASLLLLLVVMVGYTNPLWGAIYRLANPLTNFPSPQLTVLNVLPGDVELTKGSHISITTNTQGEIPPKALLYLTTDAGVLNTVEMKRVGPLSFIHKIAGINQSFNYKIQAGDAISDQYRINVITRPSIDSIHLRYKFPDYTKKKEKTTTGGGDIVALKGTQVDVTVLDNQENISKAQLYLENNTNSVPMEVTNNSAKGALIIENDHRYRIALHNTAGYENINPIWYKIIALPDREPSVRILNPAPEFELTENMVVPILISATDDYGFSALDLVYQKEPNGNVIKINIPVDKNATILRVPFIWDLSTEHILPNSVISYHIELYDNDTVSGPKKSKSRTNIVRFPSLEEIYKRIDTNQNEQVSEMVGMVNEQEVVKEKLEVLNRSLNRKSKLDPSAEQILSPDQKTEINSVLKQQEQATDNLLRAADDIRRAMEQLQDHDNQSQELIQRMKQLRELFQEIATPELLKAMRDLKQALQSVDQKSLKKSMKEFKDEQEEFLKRLERSLSMLKRIQSEQQLSAAIGKSHELTVRQEELAEASRQIPTNSKEIKLSEKQLLLRNDLNSLQNDLEQLAINMEKYRDMPVDKIHDASKKIVMDQMESRMNQISNQLKLGRIKKALTGQKLMTESLSGLHQSLKQVQDQIKQDQLQKITIEMKDAMYNLVLLSKSQESLIYRTQFPGRNDTHISIVSGDQQDLIKGANFAANKIVTIGQKTFLISSNIGRFLGKTLNSMQRAVEYLAEHKRDTASQEQVTAMGALNEAVLALGSALKKMSESSSSSAMMELIERLQRIAGQQTNINSQLNQLINETDNKSELKDRQQIARLSVQQDALRKSLRQIQKEQGDYKGQILGRLDQIEKEMAKTVKELQENHINSRLAQRQQKILSRLLDASRAIRRQNREEKRIAKPGEFLGTFTPSPLPDELVRINHTIGQDIYREIEQGNYPREYEELIRAYFRALADNPINN